MRYLIAIPAGIFGLYCLDKGKGSEKALGCGIVGFAMIVSPGGQFPYPQLLGLAFIVIAIIWGTILYQNEQNGTNAKRRAAEQKIIEQEYQQAIASQNNDTPWAVRYAIDPCPHCGHYKVRNAKWEDKQLSVAFWGAASGKIGANFKCEHCDEMW